jgi:hypothetical protein
MRVGVLGVPAAAMLAFAAMTATSQPVPGEAQDFAKLHALVKPQAGESRWMEIDWYPSIWEARQKAAAEGKPMFIWAGSGGAPAAGC